MLLGFKLKTLKFLFAIIGLLDLLPIVKVLPSPAPSNKYCNASCICENLFLLGFSS
jgi:hypothetical protein